MTPLRTDPSTAPAAPRSAAPTAPGRELDRVLAEDALQVVFQPVVDLDSGVPVALEALVRGPGGSSLVSPGELFRAAAGAGRLAELEHACLRTALRAAAGAGPATPWTLFVNGSPELLEVPDRAARHVVVDLTERALTTRPVELLRLVARLRGRGFGIALDDLGADPAAPALLPLVRPDVLKLDLRLLAARPEAEVAAIVQAVGAQAERDGTSVLAEGIETAEHLRTARALGATLGQGWLFGRPAGLADLLAQARVPLRPVPLLAREVPAQDPSFDALARRRAPRRVGADVLEEAVRHLERHALRSAEPLVVLGLGAASPERVARHEQLARRAGFALSLPRADVVGVAVLGPHFAGVVVGRAGSAPGEFDLVVSHDRDVVTPLVADLLRRSPAHPPVAAPAPPPPAGRVALSAQVGEAIDADRRVGTGTGLLVVGVDGAPGCPVASRAAVVQRMRRAVRSVDRWIPLGPDLFAVLLTGLPRAGSEGVVERVADALLMAVETSMDSHPEVSVSIGASLAPGRAATGAEAQRQAVAALDAARLAGGHCARIWPV